MPPVKALSIDSWEEPTKNDPSVRMFPYSVEQVTTATRNAIREAGSHWARSEALLDEIEDMLR